MIHECGGAIQAAKHDRRKQGKPNKTDTFLGERQVVLRVSIDLFKSESALVHLLVWSVCSTRRAAINECSKFSNPWDSLSLLMLRHMFKVPPCVTP